VNLSTWWISFLTNRVSFFSFQKKINIYVDSDIQLTSLISLRSAYAHELLISSILQVLEGSHILVRITRSWQITSLSWMRIIKSQFVLSPNTPKVSSSPSYLVGKRVALSGGYSISPLRKKLQTGSRYHWHVTLFPIDYSDQHFSNEDGRAWLTINVQLRYHDREGDISLREK